MILREQGRLTEARRLFRRALRIFHRRLGDGHPKTEMVRLNIAALDTPEQP